MSLSRFASDENFHGAIVRGLQRRNATLDILRIQDTEMSGSDDPTVLQWCSDENRILLTHDARTIPKYVYERIKKEDKTSGIFIVNDNMAIGQAIEELLITIEVSDSSEWENVVLFFPL